MTLLFNRTQDILRRSRFSQGLWMLSFCLLLAMLQPAPLLVLTGPTKSVDTLHPILGVHTRLTDEVEEWKIQRSLELVREMGATTIVEFFPWAYYHAADGSFVWEHTDMVVEHANAQGLEIIARLGLTPDWARPPDTPLTYLDETAYEDYADYASAFVERYQGKVNTIIIGNEPNLSSEWGYRLVPAEEYVDLLRVIYPAVKSANPDVTVLAGALAPNLEQEGSQWAYNDLDYLDDMYLAGAADFFDGLAVHSYGLTFPALSEPDPAILNFRRVELVREIMINHDDEDKKIYITETGWNDHPRWTLAVRPSQRIVNTIDALDYAEENWPYVENMAIWVFRFPAPIKSYMDNYTLVTPEFVLKPIYESIKEYTGN